MVQKINLLEIVVVLLLLLLVVDLEVETSRMPLLWTHTSSNTLLIKREDVKSLNAMIEALR